MTDTNDREEHFRFRGSSFDDMISTLGGAFGAFNAELMGRPQEFKWGVDFSSTDQAVSLSGFHQDEFMFHVQPTSDTDEHLSVVLPRNGGMGVNCGTRSAVAGKGQLLLYSNLEPDSIAMYGQSNLIDELLIRWSVVQQTIEGLFEVPLNGSLDLQAEVSRETPAGQVIGNLAQLIVDGMRNDGPLVQSPIAMAHLTQAITDIIARNVPHRFSQRLDRKPGMIVPRHVRRAIEFMHSKVDQPITMPMVAEAVGVSTRSLETGFRVFKQTTPAAYLRTLRLSAARADLLDVENEESVKKVCLKWGFFHFGRFSAAYKASFGETPSDTRNRVRSFDV